MDKHENETTFHNAWRLRLNISRRFSTLQRWHRILSFDRNSIERKESREFRFGAIFLEHLKYPFNQQLRQILQPNSDKIRLKLNESTYKSQ